MGELDNHDQLQRLLNEEERYTYENWCLYVPAPVNENTENSNEGIKDEQ